jgi:diacylglycerol kinase (ATP)
MVQCSLGIVVTIAGFYFDISKTDWLFQILAIGLVLSVEGLNTAEKMADFIHPIFMKELAL